MQIRTKAYISSEDVQQIGIVGKPVDTQKVSRRSLIVFRTDSSDKPVYVPFCIVSIQKPRTSKKATANGTSNGKGHARKASTTSIDDQEASDSKGSKSKTARGKSTMITNGKRRQKADGKDITEMSRKRKKGLKEWEDDTEDEEEDLEDDDTDGSEADENEEHEETSNHNHIEKIEKARPSNLRQRPARTSLASTTYTAPSVKPTSRGNGKAKAEDQAEDVQGSEAEELDDSKGETSMEVDDDVSKKALQTSVNTDSSSKENVNEQRETSASPRSKRRRRRGRNSPMTSPAKEVSSMKATSAIGHEEADESGDQMSKKPTSPSPGKRRSRRGNAIAI